MNKIAVFFILFFIIGNARANEGYRVNKGLNFGGSFIIGDRGEYYSPGFRFGGYIVFPVSPYIGMLVEANGFRFPMDKDSFLSATHLYSIDGGTIYAFNFLASFRIFMLNIQLAEDVNPILKIGVGYGGFHYGSIKVKENSASEVEKIPSYNDGSFTMDFSGGVGGYLPGNVGKGEWSMYVGYSIIFTDTPFKTLSLGLSMSF